MVLIDSHAHLEMPEFDADREAVIARAEAAGLTAIVTVGTTVPDCRKAVEIARRHRIVHAAVGIHPHEVKGIGPETYDVLRELARQAKVVALGEIGLDFFYEHSPRDVQLKRFVEQVELALELDLPVIVHDRDAHEETLEILQRYRGPLRGVVHCFSGGAAMAEACLEMGFCLSVAGPVTYKKAQELRDVVREVPADRLLVETDCPYLAPQPFRGKRNEPAYVAETARRVAEVKGMDPGELGRIAADNASRLFGLA
jgi:TatD DNase family protein